MIILTAGTAHEINLHETEHRSEQNILSHSDLISVECDRLTAETAHEINLHETAENQSAQKTHKTEQNLSFHSDLMKK